ncbi:MAG: kinase/pyrophosphorylase [Alphaproteobacteria bacterium]|nr:kinase/pyrophosphorylase [Alphaproteobacteria bacterium]
MSKKHIHLVSDSSGETVYAIARACLGQFEEVEVVEHPWWLVRTEEQVDEVIEGVKAHPGIVLCTLLDKTMRTRLEKECRKLKILCVSVLDPILGALSNFLGAEILSLPGHQHTLNAEYFRRIDAIQFTLDHDDGQITSDINDSDVVVVGVSRTSKTPTCMYLSHRGLKATNIPLIPGMDPPETLLTATHPLIVGLTRDPDHLVGVRRIRLGLQGDDPGTDYADIAAIREEIVTARRLFARHDWPVIDMTHRSIEEAAAAIIQLHAHHVDAREARENTKETV